MKKSLIFLSAFLFAIFSLMSNSAMARKSKFVIGIDGLNSKIEHNFEERVDLGNAADIPNIKGVSDSAIGVGASLGYIAYDREFIAFPEIFYDQINSDSHDFFASQPDVNTSEAGAYLQDEISINYRFGARMNFGVNVFHFLDLFANVGVANVDFDVRWKHPTARGSRRSYGSSETSLIYGFGVLLELHPNMMLRVAHDFQDIDIRYINHGHTDNVEIGVTRAGVLLAF